MKIIITIAGIFFNLSLFAQNNNEVFSRLQAVSNNGTEFYNIDGIEITKETYTNDFSDEGLKKPFRKYSIKKDLVKIKDTALPFNNYYILKSETISSGINQNTSYYFIEDTKKWLTIVSFSSFKKPDKLFEREFVKLIYNGSIPKEVFTPLGIDSINFIGRKIPLGKSCRWMSINNVQCPYYGQMSWSVHKELSDAQNTLNTHFEVTKLKKAGKIISESEVEIIFEGTQTKAKKIIYDFTGIKSLMVGMSGSKTMTIYYVATEVRNHFVSCTLSFWDNDNINPSGLPPLLEAVMKLK
ncbi:MAG: hypothetical protein H0W75_02675 [Chitinophagaceae bacterium]|nr:hypothetical protein [Chitinophagaceae bacterium]